ncbi:uncharacterized protein J4E84_004703 [Alternaria hordeiaustralica]|uniref:uncharacterized protein n=1 Tax=Alternaria hordeiaustralica TaxID=1187925 RepID=UPI0020C3BF62|nr:uncharacterized protein J4E84_004703 [Alternaria hordeiaustralica]KAI4630613.1 hypothetical protein J4E80_001551 [Alternaria sp. BMP 0032]KAI4688773.1 hypothetical protein J4E84_004703 [Alternaria hordeiaustralica]
MSSQDPLDRFVKGYPKLAAQMEILPELAIFRRFGALNAQNLLYMQAELTYLENKLRERQLADHIDPSETRKAHALNWFWLRESENTGTGEQLGLILKIRETLKEYNDALAQQAQILKYPRPSTWDLHHIQNYLHSTEMGENALTGEDGDIWGSACHRESYKPDLVTLCPRAKKDAFSAWAAESTITNLFRCGCARIKKPSRIHGVVGYEDSTIYRITYWITSILASLIPIASIAVLYRVQSMTARLGIIAGFNVLVSICLMGLANAKRAEVFAITAA